MMAQGVSDGGKCKSFVTLDVPVTVRMNVQADDVPQAYEIVNALLGNGDWTDTRRIGLPFAIKTDHVNA